MCYRQPRRLCGDSVTIQKINGSTSAGSKNGSETFFLFSPLLVRDHQQDTETPRLSLFCPSAVSSQLLPVHQQNAEGRSIT